MARPSSSTGPADASEDFLSLDDLMDLVGGQDEGPQPFPEEAAAEDNPMWWLDDGQFLAQTELDDEEEQQRVGDDEHAKRLAALG